MSATDPMNNEWQRCYNSVMTLTHTTWRLMSYYFTDNDYELKGYEYDDDDNDDDDIVNFLIESELGSSPQCTKKRQQLHTLLFCYCCLS